MSILSAFVRSLEKEIRKVQQHRTPHIAHNAMCGPPALLHTVPLPLTGGSGVLASMAGNNGFLFIGTNQSPQAVEVQKSNLTVTMIGGFSPPINVTGISADKYGYVTVTFGGFTTGENGFYTFGPTGAGVGDGGGAWFMLNTMTAVQTATLPPSAGAPNRQVGVSPKIN